MLMDTSLANITTEGCAQFWYIFQQFTYCSLFVFLTLSALSAAKFLVAIAGIHTHIPSEQSNDRLPP